MSISYSTAVHFRRSVSGITQTWHFGIARERTLARRYDIRSVADQPEGGHVLRRRGAAGLWSRSRIPAEPFWYPPRLHWTAAPTAERGAGCPPGGPTAASHP